MKLIPFPVLIFAIFLGGCGPDASTSSKATANEPEVKRAKQVSLVTRSKYPQVRLSSYTLIADDIDARRSDAEAVMQVKMELPRAVQTKEADRFERILARNFVFRAADQFYGRADYIRERANNKDTVITADYENVVLQFIGDTAFLTYRNTVVLEPGGRENTVHMTWADILVKEDGQWKFVAVHLIDSKMEKDPKAAAP
jgi:ketosteroid isomerase-like protein